MQGLSTVNETATLIPTKPSPRRTALVLLLTDAIAVTASFLLAIGLRWVWDRSLLWELYLDLWAAIALFPLAYALAGLYGVGIAERFSIARFREEFRALIQREFDRLGVTAAP